MFHRRQKEKENTSTAKLKCDVCGEMYNSLSSLNQHKQTKNHTKRSRIGEETSAPKKKRKTKQMTINDLIRKVQGGAVDDEEDENENECAAIKCIIHDGEEECIHWLSCDVCVRWFHAVCVDLGTLSQDELDKTNFTCKKCLQKK